MTTEYRQISFYEANRIGGSLVKLICELARGLTRAGAATQYEKRFLSGMKQ
jgi:hypothetical protein